MSAVEGSRPAGIDDLDDLVLLARTAITEKADQKGGPVWSLREARRHPLDDSFRRDLSDAQALVLLGEFDGVPVGYGVVRIETLADGDLLGVVHDLYVLPDARAVGIGEALLDEMLTWCRAHSCRGIDALALPGDRHTKNFFEQFGLVARAIVVHRALDPAPTTEAPR